MSAGARIVIECALATAALAAAVASGSRVVTPVDVAPVADGQPVTTSVVYDPPMLAATWLSATTAAVLVVVATARWRRRRQARRAENATELR